MITHTVNALKSHRLFTISLRASKCEEGTRYCSGVCGAGADKYVCTWYSFDRNCDLYSLLPRQSIPFDFLIRPKVQRGISAKHLGLQRVHVHHKRSSPLYRTVLRGESKGGINNLAPESEYESRLCGDLNHNCTRVLAALATCFRTLRVSCPEVDTTEVTVSSPVLSTLLIELIDDRFLYESPICTPADPASRKLLLETKKSFLDGTSTAQVGNPHPVISFSISEDHPRRRLANHLGGVTTMVTSVDLLTYLDEQYA